MIQLYPLSESMTHSLSQLELSSLMLILKTLNKMSHSLFTSLIHAPDQLHTKLVILLPFSQMLPTHLLPGRTTKLPNLADSISKLVLLNSSQLINGTETLQSLTASLLP
jgi:hypothetical protein